MRNGQTQVVDGVQIAVDLGNVVEFQQHMFVVHDYSSLKTMAGSIRVARRTGGMEAMTTEDGGAQHTRQHIADSSAEQTADQAVDAGFHVEFDADGA